MHKSKQFPPLGDVDSFDINNTTNNELKQMTTTPTKLNPCPVETWQMAQLNINQVTNNLEGDERFEAGLRETVRFLAHAMLDCLVLDVWNKRERGETNYGVTYELMSNGAFYMLGNADEAIAKASEQYRNEMLKAALQQLIDSGSVCLVDEEQLVIGLTFEVPEQPEQAEEMKTTVINGVEYPHVSSLSPKQMMHFSRNRHLFDAMYPGGRFEAIQTSARLLQEGVLTFYEHRGSFMYHLDTNA